MNTLRQLTATVCASLALASMSAVYAANGENYPDKTVRVVVPFLPGGGNDFLGRDMSQALQKEMNTSFVVENKAGAGGLIGSDFVAKSKPDGYTLLVAANTATMVDATTTNAPFSLEKDLAGVGMMASMPLLLVVSSELGVKTTAELIQLAKSKPGELNYASSGPGTVQHMAGALFAAQADIKMEHVPFKGASQMIPELLANRVQVLIGPANSVLPFIKAGKLVALGVSTDQRWNAMPDVPTISESGVPGYKMDLWYALMVPRQTPKAVVQTLNTKLNEYLNQPETRARYDGQAMTPWPSTPQEVDTLIASDIARWKKVAKEIGLQTN
jgi:tripartite-type tricarboxylate transporter receptor subunit TctC